MSKLKTVSVVFLASLFLSLSGAEMEGIDVSESVLTPRESYEIEFDSGEDSGTEVEVEENIFIGEDNVQSEEVIVEIGEEDRTLPYIRELDAGSSQTFFSTWTLDLIYEGSSNQDEFEVKPNNYLSSVDISGEVDIVTVDGSYDDLADELNERTDGSINSTDEFDEDYKEENDKVVLLGKPSEIDLINDLGESAAEIRSSSQVNENELNLGYIETKNITTVIVSGEGDGVNNAVGLLEHILDGNLDSEFDDVASTMLTESDYSEKVSGLANVGLHVEPIGNVGLDDPVEYEITLVNNEDFSVSGEVLIDNEVQGEIVNETKDFDLSPDSEQDGVVSTDSTFEPGENNIVIEVLSSDGELIEDFSDSHDLPAEELENALSLELEIEDISYDASPILELSLENLLDEEADVKRNITHYFEKNTEEEDLINHRNDSVSLSSGSSSSTVELENETVEGNHTFVVEYLDEDDSVVESNSVYENLTRPDEVGVSVDVESFESSIEVETELSDYFAFTDSELELEYLKDDTLINRESFDIDDHGSSETTSYTHDELESLIFDATGESSIIGEHRFRAETTDV